MELNNSLKMLHDFKKEREFTLKWKECQKIDQNNLTEVTQLITGCTADGTLSPRFLSWCHIL